PRGHVDRAAVRGRHPRPHAPDRLPDRHRDPLTRAAAARPRRIERMTRYLHTMLRITNPERGGKFYEPLGLEFRKEVPIVRAGHHEATNYFYGVPGQDEELELTWNTDGR